MNTNPIGRKAVAEAPSSSSVAPAVRRQARPRTFSTKTYPCQNTNKGAGKQHPRFLWDPRLQCSTPQYALKIGQALPGWPSGTVVLARDTSEDFREGVVYLDWDYEADACIAGVGAPTGRCNLLTLSDGVPIYRTAGPLALRIVALSHTSADGEVSIERSQCSPSGFTVQGGRLAEAPPVSLALPDLEDPGTRCYEVYRALDTCRFDCYYDAPDIHGSADRRFQFAAWMDRLPAADRSHPGAKSIPPNAQILVTASGNPLGIFRQYVGALIVVREAEEGVKDGLVYAMSHGNGVQIGLGSPLYFVSSKFQPNGFLDAEGSNPDDRDSLTYGAWKQGGAELIPFRVIGFLIREKVEINLDGYRLENCEDTHWDGSLFPSNRMVPV